MRENRTYGLTRGRGYEGSMVIFHLYLYSLSTLLVKEIHTDKLNYLGTLET